MNENEIEAYLASQFKAPIKSLTWNSDDRFHKGDIVLDTSGIVKDHPEIRVGIHVERESEAVFGDEKKRTLIRHAVSDDDQKIQIGHAVESANSMIEALKAQKGAA